MDKKIEWLKLASKYHNDWLGIAASYVGSDLAEDIVQEVYLSIHKWADDRIIKPDGRLNRSYVWLAIRSQCALHFKDSKGRDSRELGVIKDLDQAIEVSQKTLAWDRLIESVNDLIDSWCWYDRTLFRLYRDTPFSLRGLAAETGISWMSIHTTIKKCKTLILDEFEEDYEDYINGDYELVCKNK